MFAIRVVNVALQDDSLQAHAIAQQWHAHGHAGDAFTRNVMSNVMRYVCWKAAIWCGVRATLVATPPGDEQQIVFQRYTDRHCWAA